MSSGEKKKAVDYLVFDDSRSSFIEPGKEADVDNLVKDYIAGYPVRYLQEKYTMSAGQLFSHLRARQVPLRNANQKGTSLDRRLARLTKKQLADIVEDYLNGVPNEVIYSKYSIHKNGLYKLLDSNGIERKMKGRK